MLVPPLAQEHPEGYSADDAATNQPAAPTTLGVDDIQSLASSFSEEVPSPAQSPAPGGFGVIPGQPGATAGREDSVVDLAGDDAQSEAKKNFGTNPMS